MLSDHSAAPKAVIFCHSSSSSGRRMAGSVVALVLILASGIVSADRLSAQRQASTSTGAVDLGQALMRAVEQVERVESLAAVDRAQGRVDLGSLKDDDYDEPPRGPGGRYDLQPGWWRVKLEQTNAHFDLYAPESWQEDSGLPAVVFLHGAGATTSVYHEFLSEAADASGVLLALPKSQSNRGWGFPGDSQSLFETLIDLRDRAGADPSRIAIAGHSAGGAYAYLNAYLSSTPFSAVFTLGAPFYEIGELRNPDGYVPPIRMYYGTDDFNLISGDAEQLILQWQRLGVDAELDVQLGYGHNTWPAATMFDGFEFLTSHSTGTASGVAYCQASETTLCLRDDRFEVTLQWRDFADHSGMAHALEDLQSDQSGIFWFFSENNWEMLVKVIDGCTLNKRYWVLAAATTNIGYTLTVRDVVADQVAVYSNPVGDASPAIVDTSALATCPPPAIDQVEDRPGGIDFDR